MNWKNNQMLSRIRVFIKDIGIFIWYLCTEPLRTVKMAFKLGKQQTHKMFKQSSILILYFGIVIFLFLSNSKNIKYGFMLLLLVAILRYEWTRGKFRKRWKDDYKKKLFKKYKTEVENGNKYNSYK